MHVNKIRFHRRFSELFLSTNDIGVPIVVKIAQIMNNAAMTWRIKIFILFAGELFIFYSIFYIVLALLFAICMAGLMYTIDERTPKWQLLESRIGNSPGLGYRPISNNLTRGSLIWFDSKNQTEVNEHVGLLNHFLKRKLLLNHGQELV